MKPLNVLVSCAGSQPGVAVINALKGQREIAVRVVAADMDPLSIGFQMADASRLVPSARSPDFIPTVRRICREERIDVAFPIIDEELQAFADSAADLAADGVRVITNPPETVRLAKDKILTVRRCEELGILTPPTLLPEELGTRPLPPFPLIIKPRDGRGTVGVHVARDQQELEFFLRYVPNAMIQQKIAGPEYTIDVLTTFDGTMLSVVPKERLMVKSGMQVKGRTVRDPELSAFATRVTRAFQLWPRGNVQCIRGGDGQLYLIEINPKFPASLPFTVAAGVNAPLQILKLHLGRPVVPAPDDFVAGLTMLRCWQERYVPPDPHP